MTRDHRILFTMVAQLVPPNHKITGRPPIKTSWGSHELPTRVGCAARCMECSPTAAPTVPTPPSVLSIYSNWQSTKYAARRPPWRGAAASAPSVALPSRTTAGASTGCHPRLPPTLNNKISETHTLLPEARTPPCSTCAKTVAGCGDDVPLLGASRVQSMRRGLAEARRSSAYTAAISALSPENAGGGVCACAPQGPTPPAMHGHCICQPPPTLS